LATDLPLKGVVFSSGIGWKDEGKSLDDMP